MNLAVRRPRKIKYGSAVKLRDSGLLFCGVMMELIPLVFFPCLRDLCSFRSNSLLLWKGEKVVWVGRLEECEECSSVRRGFPLVLANGISHCPSLSEGYRILLV